MTDHRAREIFELENVIDTIHVLTPDDVFVTADVIIGWAAAHIETTPTLEEAIQLLTDLGTHTFEQAVLTHGVSVNRMCDVLRPLGRACFPKEQHETQGAAEAQVRSLTRRSLEKDAGRIHAYKCPHCPGWHVGHGRIA